MAAFETDSNFITYFFSSTYLLLFLLNFTQNVTDQLLFNINLSFCGAVLSFKALSLSVRQSFKSVFRWQLHYWRDLQIRGEERLRVRDLISSFLAYCQKARHPVILHCTYILPEKLALLSLLEEVKQSPGRNMIKLLTIYSLFPSLRPFSLTPLQKENDDGQGELSRFPAKITVVHARALLSIDKKTCPRGRPSLGIQRSLFIHIIIVFQ